MSFAAVRSYDRISQSAMCTDDGRFTRHRPILRHTRVGHKGTLTAKWDSVGV